MYLAKGNYYELQGTTPFRHLIYPVPEKAGLGVHLTLNLGGRGRFGPDVEWIDSIHYDVDPNRATNFYEAIRRYWPDLREGSLRPGYAGIRSKLTPPGGGSTDFVIQGSETHGAPGLVNLFGIESPGLTAALAIADEVERRLA
jgi:L-2-hydroxyglutarate oxidase LhgO